MVVCQHQVKDYICGRHRNGTLTTIIPGIIKQFQLNYPPDINFIMHVKQIF